MSKKFGARAYASPRAKRRHPACAWLALLLFLVAVSCAPSFLAPSGSAQRPNQPSGKTSQGPAAATKATRNAALVAATNDVLKETSEIRQLSILHPVQSSTQSREEIERMLIKNLDEEMTPGRIHAAEITLKKLDLAPADFHYRALMLRLLTEQVAGYYDPRTQQFHLADWIDLDGQKPIMAHELTHALQDQHFNLRRFEHWPKGDSDAELAAHALIEGDAMLTMALYVANSPLRALAFLKSLGATGMSTAELDNAPRALRETLLFPYQEGTAWTRTLYRQGGWERVSKAFVELPQSTEQILHPAKYFVHEAPVRVSLPDVTNLLNRGVRVQGSGSRGRATGDRGRQPAVIRLTAHRPLLIGYDKSVPPASAGGYSSPITHRSSLRSDPRPTIPGPWRRIDYDVNGEWGFYLILDQFLKSAAESRRAAAGWGGDRFEVYEGPHGEACFISLSVWDTETDAREFFDAYIKRTELRYPDAAQLDSADSATRNSKPETGNSYSWRTSEGTVVIDLRGNRVLILESIPGGVDSNALRRALWQ